MSTLQSEYPKIAGANARNANYWAVSGVMRIEVPPAGRGSDARYDFDDVLALAALAELPSHTSNTLLRQVAAEIQVNPSAISVDIEVGRFSYLTIHLFELRQHVRAAAIALAKARGEKDAG